MCFSAKASFLASAILISTGIYCLTQSFKKNHSYLSLAAFPVLFGIQQFLEGMVWVTLETKDIVGTKQYTLAYLFLLNFWTFLVPFSLYYIEKNIDRKNILKWFSIMGLIFAISQYLPLLINTVEFTVSIMHHSIRYTTDRHVAIKVLSTIAYMLVSIVPFFLCSEKVMRIFGALLIIAIIVAYLWYHYAFSSIWCFFSAYLSLYIAFALYTLNSRGILKSATNH